MGGGVGGWLVLLAGVSGSAFGLVLVVVVAAVVIVVVAAGRGRWIISPTDRD